MIVEPIGPFSERLRRLRERAGLTQEALAERAGLTTNAIGALERGERRRPYPHTVRALADALDLAAAERAALFASGAGRVEQPATPAALPNSASLPQLPTQLTSLVGRTAEATLVEQLLKRPDVRLLTLLGPGGVGKTRLAVEVASACAGAFDDGVAFVALAPLERAELVLPTITRALGIQETGGSAPLHTLMRWLRERHFLLLLDNCEHVLGAALDLAELLLACPRLKLLATSREALHLRGEQEYPVPPLAFPRASAMSADAMLQYEAVRLFVQRAQALRPDFALTASNAKAIAQICARLDGLPLAIELAAARAALLSPQALLARLSAGTPGEAPLQLAGGARDLPARQQTMRATVAWSYNLLTPTEQRLLRRLAIFADGATLEAINKLCAPDAGPGQDCTELVASLVHKHLVRRAEQAQDEPRFEMLETIRAFGLEQLRTTGEFDAVAATHARTFLELAEAAAPHLMRRDQTRWFRALDDDLNNLRAAMQHYLDQGNWAEAVRLVWALWRFWWVRGLHREARQWNEQLLAHAPAPELAPLQRAQAELTIGSMAWAAGDLDAAEQHCAAALAQSAQHDSRRTEAIALMMLGATMVSSGADRPAEELLARSVVLFQAIGEAWGAAFALSYSGLLLLKQGTLERALATFTQALTLARRSGDLTITHQVLYIMGMAAQLEGAHERAAAAFDEGLALSLELADSVNVGYFIKGIAELATLHLDAARGVRLLGAAQALMDTIGVPFQRDAPGRPWHTQLLAQVRGALGDAAFDRLWAEGRTLSIQQTYAEAQELGRALTADAASWAETHLDPPFAMPGTAAHPTLPRAAPGFARTKLQPPRPRTDLLARARLLERLRPQLTGTRLVLVTAPAGAGKTTLLMSWLSNVERRTQNVEQANVERRTQNAERGSAEHDEHPVLRSTLYALRSVWLTLDGDDNDLARFLALLLGAFDQLAPGAGRAAAQLLEERAGAPPLSARVQPLLDAALNGLLDAPAAPSLLIIDDLHMVTAPAIYAALEYLIARLPAHMTLALASRHDPPLSLARLRARRELVELRPADLRFTRDETESLLNERLALALPAEAIALLHTRTEGWAAGLSLLAASLDTITAPEERARFVTHLTGSASQLFDYLADEVLNRQDPFTRAFLLETAILPELTPQACRALTGRDDAAQVLDDLYRRNLFLVEIGGQGSGFGVRGNAASIDAALPRTPNPEPRTLLPEPPTYRYHDLFRTFLRARLRAEAPEWLRQLHARAAATASDPARAIEHYLEAELWDAAAEALERLAEPSIAARAFERLRGWIAQLPPAAQEARPQLLLWLGICHWQCGAFEPARTTFARARAGFAAAGDPLGQGEALGWLALDECLYGEPAAAQSMLAQALAFPLPPQLRIYLLAARALGLLLAGNWQLAIEALDDLMALAEASSEPQLLDSLMPEAKGS